MNITYHKAGLNDLPELIRHRITFALLFSEPPSPQAIEELKEVNQRYFEKAIPENSFVAYLAKHGDQVAGIGGMVVREQPGGFKNPSGKTGYLMMMYTVPEFRRKGVCTGILKALIGEGIRMGIIAFELQASSEGEFVYRRNGFLKHHEPTYKKYIAGQPQTNQSRLD